MQSFFLKPVFTQKVEGKKGIMDHLQQTEPPVKFGHAKGENLILHLCDGPLEIGDLVTEPLTGVDGSN